MKTSTRQYRIKLEVSCACVVKKTAFLKEKPLSSAPGGGLSALWYPALFYVLFPWGFWSLDSVNWFVMQVWTLFILGIFSFFLATTLICFLWLQKTVSVGTPLFWVLCFLANTEFKGDNETSPWMFTQLVWNELVLGPPTPTLVPRWLYCENCSFMCCFISLVLLRLTVAFFVCFLYSCN